MRGVIYYLDVIVVRLRPERMHPALTLSLLIITNTFCIVSLPSHLHDTNLPHTHVLSCIRVTSLPCNCTSFHWFCRASTSRHAVSDRRLTRFVNLTAE